MLRRISLIAAATAMLALSALPASAAMQSSSSTHKLSFPGLHGVKAWGTYVKTSRGVRVNVCAEDTGGVFAAGAVVVASNASKKLHTNIGAVAFGDHQQICRFMTLRYNGHLQVYTFTGTKKGTIGSRSKTKNVF
jgi:hypothetical protein